MDEFVFELDKKVNMGKITDNDFKESKSISLIRDLLEKNNKIKVRTTEADKIPDLDGRVSILDTNKHDRIIVEVQSKTLPEEYNEDNPYHYDCDTKVLNVVKYNKSFNPVVLFLSDIKNKKLYYKLITKEYIKELNFSNQENKRIKFDDNDLYEEEKFIKEIVEYARLKTLIINSGENALVTSYINGPNKYYNLMQEEIDKVNYRFDHDLKVIKDTLFPHVWKFGIAYNKTEKGFVLGIYKVYKGSNDTLVKNFDIESNYMLSTFSNADGNISDVLNGWTNKCINEFYNVYTLHPNFCCDDALSEIIFNFLDNITYLSDRIKNKNNWDYYKDKEKVNVIHSYVNGLTKFYKTIWNDREKYPDAKILEPSYKVINKFIIFNPFVTFPNSKQLLEKCIFEKDDTPFQENVFYNSHINMDLVMSAIIELEKRGIKEISRIHSKYDNNLVEKIFMKLKESYEYTQRKLKLDDKQMIKGQYTIYYFEKKQDAYCLNYNDNKSLEIIFKKEKEDKYEDIKNNSIQFGVFKDFSRIQCPLYNLTRLLINKGCMEAQGMNFKFISETLDIFNLNDFPILTTNIKRD
ncbi:MAG: DUF4365 domain-containing protein [Clostridia bacterium]|nr:DUF4365 domain-containing protein [Clostridia bacterium]